MANYIYSKRPSRLHQLTGGIVNTYDTLSLRRIGSSVADQVIYSDDDGCGYTIDPNDENTIHCAHQSATSLAAGAPYDPYSKGAWPGKGRTVFGSSGTRPMDHAVYFMLCAGTTLMCASPLTASMSKYTWFKVAALGASVFGAGAYLSHY